METPWPGSVEILAGMGAQWRHEANKLHSSCHPRHRGDDVLLLNQQLG